MTPESHGPTKPADPPALAAWPRFSRWRFVRHPTWGLRMVRNHVRDEILWRQQGRPADGVLVVRPGELRVGPDGERKVLYGWSISLRRGFAGPFTPDELWSILERRYPETIRNEVRRV